MSRVPITFRIYMGERLIRTETLNQPVIKIGKLPSSHLCLEDDGVSRMHAVVEVNGQDEVSIIDLGSSRGTLVNGQKINKARIVSGDTIQLGNLRVEVAVGEVAQRAAATPARPQVPSRSAPPVPPAAMPARPAPAAPVHASVAVPAVVPAPTPAPMPAPVAAPAVIPAQAQADVGEAGGQRAVEVAVMLGNSVVEVKHLTNPRTGKVTAATYALFGCGAAMLLAAMLAFGIGTRHAERNQTARTEWIQKLNKPAHEFRPAPLSPAYDLLMFGGLLGGFVALTMGLVRLRNEKQSPYFRIGTAPEVEFATSDAPGESFPLVGPVGDDFAFHFAAGMKGEIHIDGQAMALSELATSGRARPSAVVPEAMQLAISPQSRIRVELGKSTFLIASVPPPRRQAMPLITALESRALAFFGGSAVVHLGLIALLLSIPPEPQALAASLRDNSMRSTRFAFAPTEAEKQPEPEASPDQASPASAAMALAEGKMGDPNTARLNGRFEMKKRGDEPQLAKDQSIAQARGHVMLASLHTGQQSVFHSMLATSDFSSGLGEVDIYGDLNSAEVALARGDFGFGVKGTGPGGGGPEWGIIGTSKYGRILGGPGIKDGSGSCLDDCTGTMRRHKAIGPGGLKIGDVASEGTMDKSIIRRYIRQKLPSITHCYERELQVKPEIAGTVTAQFQISPQGKVLNASAQGVDASVSSCVADVIESIQFPKPPGSDMVQVRYPFTFRATGS